MADILDFGYLQKSKHLDNVSGRFLIPQNICLDTLLVFLVCMVRKFWSKYENDGHFGRHLGFWRMPTGNFRGLFISDSTHIPGPILKKSACYQKCPPLWALWPNTTGLIRRCQDPAKIKRLFYRLCFHNTMSGRFIGCVYCRSLEVNSSVRKPVTFDIQNYLIRRFTTLISDLCGIYYQFKY